jgi:hypothetical protein
VLNYIRDHKGRSLLIAGIVLMWVFLFGAFKYYGYEKTWHLWGVPSEMPPFKDFRLIPGSAESFRNGFEPTIRNPYDPNGRIFNYPFFWRLFFYTNITQDDTVWIAIGMLILFFVGVMLFPQELSLSGALLMMMVVFSPASMLLYERGNADLIVFSLCAMAVIATGYSAGLTAGLLVFGSVVKMFPLFGITILLRETKQKFYKLAIGSVLFVLIYGILTFKSQSAAWNTTMRGNGASYGSFVLITRLGEYLLGLLPVSFSYVQLQMLFEVLAIILILIAGILAIREPDVLEGVYERNLAAFRMGASIYVGTFLLGNNWDYRLAFLVFVIPQLTDWFRLDDKKKKNIVYAVLIAILIACWHFLLKIDLVFLPLKDFTNRNFIFDELINWLMVPGLTFLLVASFPAWLKLDLQKVFGVRKRK